ncbi:kinase-like domain-containing protein [Flammula alnicola]|nr:kinase-like domain-containing protein [Flammula alnicola]
MDFFRQHTTIPVPRIHMAFEREGTVYIVMDFVAGTTLIDSYISLSLEELQGIAEQLADFILQIRGLPIAPQTSLGSSNGGPFRNVYFRALPWDEVHNSVEPADAFQSVTDFNAYWLSRSKLDIPLDRTEHDRAVLTHGDLAGRNVLIDKGEIVGIVDWETFGCYPEFWETMVMWRDARWSKKWRTVLERTFGARTIIHDSYIRLLDTSFQEPLRY